MSIYTKQVSTILSIFVTILTACSEPVPNVAEGRAFGLHFDFHAGPKDTLVGSTLSEDDIREICELFKPDFIQIDSKGHPGWASYPSQYGNSVPGIKDNPLMVWRKVTKEAGVGLYAHYSGVYDAKWCSEHPEDAIMLPNGERSKRFTRTNSSYVDKLLIPQLKEIASYGLDGVWLDGECWGVLIDSDPKTVAEFEKETGIDLNDKVPYSYGDPYIEQYAEFHRDLYCRYLRHYVDAVHEEYPEFRIASNWAFTEHMPTPVCADVQFVSGDLPWQDCIYWGRYSARSAAMQRGMQWDMMSWAFRAPEGKPWVFKNPVQIMQEGAEVISLGGGFQIYVPQLRDGSPRMEVLRSIAPVAKFIHERIPWTYGGVPRPQVAILMSTDQRFSDQLRTYYGPDDAIRQVWGRAGYQRIIPVLSDILEAGHSVTLISEADYDHLQDYPVLVIPSLSKPLSETTKECLNTYEAHGGTVLKCDELSEELCDAVSKAYEPEIKVLESDGILEIVDFEKDGMRMAQLINGNGKHHDNSVMVEDSIPPVRNVKLSIALDEVPHAIWLEPEGRKIPFRWSDGRAEVKIPEIKIHSTIVIQ